MDLIDLHMEVPPVRHDEVMGDRIETDQTAEANSLREA
jgi:hypothetical protein